MWCKYLLIVAICLVLCSCSSQAKPAMCGELYLSWDTPPDYSGNSFAHGWTYDVYEDKCMEFICSTCRGNQNQFKTRDECEKTCMDKPDSKVLAKPKIHIQTQVTEMSK